MAGKTTKAPVASPTVASDKKKALETALAQIEKNAPYLDGAYFAERMRK